MRGPGRSREKGNHNQDTVYAKNSFSIREKIYKKKRALNCSKPYFFLSKQQKRNLQSPWSTHDSF